MKKIIYLVALFLLFIPTVFANYEVTNYRVDLTILENGDIKVVFDKPQRAITKGQSIVFYKNKTVLGGGIIIK